jgi:hypothetical protein
LNGRRRKDGITVGLEKKDTVQVEKEGKQGPDEEMMWVHFSIWW